MSERAVDVYEKAGRFDYAARVAKEAGMSERAVDVYEKAGEFDYAARVAKEAGMSERAKALRKLEKMLR